jgi:hypothetical protein
VAEKNGGHGRHPRPSPPPLPVVPVRARMTCMNADERQADGRWTEKELRSVNRVVLFDSLILALIALLWLFFR